MKPRALRRVIGLPALVLYGLGTTVGAGIYALVGEIAGQAGMAAPLSFLLASLVAGLTACSFAELAGRFPRAAGAALYVREGFGSRQLARVVGLLVVAAGVVSAAALLNAFTGYLGVFVSWDRTLVTVLVALAIGGVAAWGIAQSVTAAALITLIEVGALLVVIALGLDGFADLGRRLPEFVPGDAPGWGGMLLGVTLAFYAFIGFEDMVDVAEEVKAVERTLPLGILATLGITTVIYLLLITTALLALPPERLAASPAPLATLVEAYTGRGASAISLVALFAILNGALIQVVMASRVLYGLASRGQLPALLARVHPRTRTPLPATAMAAALVLALALYGRLAGLAAATSVIMLTIFVGVNLSLWRIKGRDAAGAPAFAVPRWMPLAGAGLSSAFVLRELVLLLR